MGLRTLLATSALVSASIAALPVPALAALESHWLQANGSGVCQAALPSYEGQIRKRPLAIQNEGTAPAFVTCSPASLQFVAMASLGHGIYLANASASEVTVNCTAVMGASTWSSEYAPKSVTLSAGSGQMLYWTAADFPTNGPSNRTTFNTSCQLAPGVGIRTIYVNQDFDIGD